MDIITKLEEENGHTYKIGRRKWTYLQNWEKKVDIITIYPRTTAPEATLQGLVVECLNGTRVENYHIE